MQSCCCCCCCYLMSCEVVYFQWTILSTLFTFDCLLSEKDRCKAVGMGTGPLSLIAGCCINYSTGQISSQMSGIIHIIYDIIVCFSDEGHGEEGEGAWPCPTEVCCTKNPSPKEEGKLHCISNVQIYLPQHLTGIYIVFIGMIYVLIVFSEERQR